VPDAATWSAAIAALLGVGAVSDALVAHLQQQSGGNFLVARLLARRAKAQRRPAPRR
jgi:hypothetical protein